MKTIAGLLAAAIISLLPSFTEAQCVTPLELISFDSVVTGSGNAYHSFTFPKFDPSKGTLVEVNIKAEVTLSYRFQLENRENMAINNYRVRVVRDDEISSSALQTPINFSHQATYGPYALAANDGVTGSGPDYMAAGPMYAMNRQVMQATVNNTADYLGSGTVTLDYSASTYSIVFGSVNYNFNGTAEDTVRFMVTYRYCSTWFLAADATNFNAVLKNDGSVDLGWSGPNRTYTIEKSMDGRNFSAIATTANNKYNYVPTETGKIIFRLKQSESKYSPLRIVDLHKKQEGIKLYPNPSNGTFNIMFSNTKRGDWEVSVLTMQGQIINKYNFSRALVGRISIDKKGLYLIKAVNKRTEEQFSLPMLVQ